VLLGIGRRHLPAELLEALDDPHRRIAVAGVVGSGEPDRTRAENRDVDYAVIVHRREMLVGLQASALTEWGPFAIGAVIAIGLAFFVPGRTLLLLGLLALFGFVASFTWSSSYAECDPCTPTAERLFWANTILFSLAPSLLVLGSAKMFAKGGSETQTSRD
jgi:hypothetical protein